jgi:hypothetical protein
MHTKKKRLATVLAIATPDEILWKGLEMGGLNHRRQQRVTGHLFAAIQRIVHSTQKEYQDYPLTVFCKHIHQEVKHCKFIAQHKAMAEK